MILITNNEYKKSSSYIQNKVGYQLYFFIIFENFKYYFSSKPLKRVYYKQLNRTFYIKRIFWFF